MASVSDCCPFGQDQSNYSMESAFKCDLNAFLTATAITHGDSDSVLENVSCWCSSTIGSLRVDIGFGELARLKYPCNPGRGTSNRGEVLEETVYESHLNSSIYWDTVLSWKKHTGIRILGSQPLLLGTSRISNLFDTLPMSTEMLG